MKRACLLICVSFSAGVFSGSLCAETADPCASMAGSVLAQCRIDQQAIRQQQLEQQVQQQAQRQNELYEQQQEVQKQLESMRLQNEALRNQLRETASHPAQAAATDSPKSAEAQSAEFKRWVAENTWFGTDYPRTDLALRYAKQLKKERPDLVGRPLLDALSAKVNETFGAKQ